MKKILVLAIAAAFSSAAAMAEVTIYGSVRTSIEYSTIDDDNDANDISRVRLVDQSSRLGFMGSEKLDNGLTILWKSEHRIRIGGFNIDGSNDTAWGTRDSYIGVDGAFGYVRAGRYDDIIDASKGDFFIGIDNMEETSAGVTKFVRRGNSKPANVLSYHSPSFGGYKFKAQYDFGSKNNTATTNGVAATTYYNSNLFDAGLGFKQVNDSTSSNASTIGADGARYQYYLAGANLKPIPGLNISAAWDRVNTRASAASPTISQDGFALGATYATGRTTFGLSAGMLQDSETGGTKNSDTSSWGLDAGVKYALSKQTFLLAGATYVNNDKNSSTGANTVASTDGVTTTLTGTKITAVSVGIRTDF